MLVPLFLAVALVTSATPLPSPSPATPTDAAAPTDGGAPTQPLREIGHVYSNGACTAIVVRANSAISTALRNDQTVTLLVSTLRAVNLDSTNRIVRVQGQRELEKYADDLRLSAIRAGKQVEELRKMAKEATDPTRKADLKEFADALGGALARQKKIGADMQGMLTRIAGRESVVDTYQQMEKTSRDTMPAWNSFADVDYHTSVYNQMAANEASYLDLQVPLIQDDESKAADHVVGAVNGC